MPEKVEFILEDVFPAEAPPRKISAENENGMLIVKVEGYGLLVAAVQLCKGRIELLVFSDRDTDAPTHTIDLEGAKGE